MAKILDLRSVEGINLEGEHVGKRIAVLNTYLNINTKIAEAESSLRFINAAARLGIHAKEFKNIRGLDAFNPDFVITLSYHDPKLTDHYTVGLLTAPSSWVFSSNRFIRNFATYDAFVSTSAKVTNDADLELSGLNKKVPSLFGGFSLPSRPFFNLRYDQGIATYLGTNWDKNRHQRFFEFFKHQNRLKVYGPKSSWRHLPADLYGGTVPFDAQSVVKTYQANGIGLCLNHPDFDDDALTTNRIFEIPASSAVMIAQQNEFLTEHFQDSVFYIDKNQSPLMKTKQIIDFIDQIRGRPDRAAQMAEASNAVFNSKLSGEVLIDQLIKFVESDKKTLKDRSESYQLKRNAPNHVCVIVLTKNFRNTKLARLLACIENQTYPYAKKFILVENDGWRSLTAKKAAILKELDAKNLRDKYVIIERSKTELFPYKESLKNFIQSEDLLNYVNETDQLFKNHVLRVVDHTTQVSSLMHHDRSNKLSSMPDNLGVIFVGVSQQIRWWVWNAPDMLSDHQSYNSKGRKRLSQFTNLRKEDILSNAHRLPLLSMFFRWEHLNKCSPSLFIGSIVAKLLSSRPYLFVPYVTTLTGYSKQKHLAFFKR